MIWCGCCSISGIRSGVETAAGWLVEEVEETEGVNLAAGKGAWILVNGDPRYGVAALDPGADWLKLAGLDWFADEDFESCVYYVFIY